MDEWVLVIRVKGGIWEVRHASFLCCNLMEKRSFSTIDFPLWTFQHTLICKEWHFCNPNCLPIYLSSIFCFFMEGALRIADPYVPFLFFWLFLLIFYLRLPLLLPRSQIKQLGTLILYLTTGLPRLNSLGRLLSLFYNRKLKHGMIQIRLLDHPSKLSQHQAYVHTLSSHGNMGSLNHQSRANLELLFANHEIWNLLV